MSNSKWEEEGRLLDQLIRERGYSQAEIAMALGLTPDVVNNMCRGVTKIKGPRLKLLAAQLRMEEHEFRDRVFHVNEPVGRRVRESRHPWPKDLLNTVNVRGKVIIVPEGTRAVPIYGGVPAGDPGRDFSDAMDVEFMPEWTGPFHRWGTRVKGHSMLPEFEDDDIVIFEDRAANSNQAVYALLENQDATFKVLRETDGMPELHPLNPEYDVLNIDEGWQVKGVLCERIRYMPNGLVDRRTYPAGFTFPRPRKITR